MCAQNLPKKLTKSKLTKMCVNHLPQIQKSKLHGSIDVGLSVMSIKKRARRIDLDTEEHIYHLKVTPMTRINTVPSGSADDRVQPSVRPPPLSGQISRNL